MMKETSITIEGLPRIMREVFDIKMIILLKDLIVYIFYLFQVMISMTETIMEAPQGEMSVIMITIGIHETGSVIDTMRTKTVMNVIGTMRKGTSIMIGDLLQDIMTEVMKSMREIGDMTDMRGTDTHILAVRAEDPLPLELLLLTGEITRIGHHH